MAIYSFVIDNHLGGILTPLILNQDGDIIDISAATEILFRFEKPDGTIVDKTGTKNTDGLDGVAKYTFSSGELDQEGLWYYWLRITAPAWTLSTSEKKTFSVREY